MRLLPGLPSLCCIKCPTRRWAPAVGELLYTELELTRHRREECLKCEEECCVLAVCGLLAVADQIKPHNVVV